MARRQLSESGIYHIVTRSAGQIALFEDESDYRRYLRLLKKANEQAGSSILAWVLMTDHVHLIASFGDSPHGISAFMREINLAYSRYFNSKTGRTGTLFQGKFWSKPITDDAQLLSTIHYVHMNPEAAGIAGMRDYRWSSYQEYAGTHWVVDTSLVLGLLGDFESFDAYEATPESVVCEARDGYLQDSDVLAYAIDLAHVTSSNELRLLPRKKRNELIRTLRRHGIAEKVIARTFGVGVATVSRALNA